MRKSGQKKKVKAIFREKPATVTHFSDTSPWALESTRRGLQSQAGVSQGDRTENADGLK